MKLALKRIICISLTLCFILLLPAQCFAKDSFNYVDDIPITQKNVFSFPNGNIYHCYIDPSYEDYTYEDEDVYDITQFGRYVSLNAVYKKAIDGDFICKELGVNKLVLNKKTLIAIRDLALKYPEKFTGCDNFITVTFKMYKVSQKLKFNKKKRQLKLSKIKKKLVYNNTFYTKNDYIDKKIILKYNKLGRKDFYVYEWSVNQMDIVSFVNGYLKNLAKNKHKPKPTEELKLLTPIN
ncbi:hypothetical protein SAMN05216391_1222 [Lachnospiraceae bacterium KHCPX20]|nr:hypothetical protein SAMN05216391_1222 [Lachnospiraceae bacterium KHCPX20]